MLDFMFVKNILKPYLVLTSSEKLPRSSRLTQGRSKKDLKHLYKPDNLEVSGLRLNDGLFVKL